MHRFLARPAATALLVSTLVLAACGGGGGGGRPAAGGEDSEFIPPTTALGSSDQYAGMCAVDTQKSWVRSYLDEVYLWYDEIPFVEPGAYATAADYFHALLVRTPDANGKPRDQFSAALPIPEARAVLQQSFGSGGPLAADGNLLATPSDAVPLAKVVTSPDGRRAGYIRFNDFSTGAQDDMITAFRALRAEGVQDLVLDLRANSGGLLYIALTVASMVTGPSSEGKVFERLQYNGKRRALSQESTLPFSSRVQLPETRYPEGTPLPQLNLPRLYVLSSHLTCSSSESVINGLRGIDVEVILVGDSTCGKPYGFQRRDNCGYAYFPIEFKGANAKGFGDYAGGFPATCRVADDADAAGGSAGDPLLAAALQHADSGACPAASMATLRSGLPSVAATGPVRPAWAGRLLQ